MAGVRMPTGALSPLRSSRFRLLFFGQTISAAGDRLVPVALAFGVLELTGSVTDLGLVLAATELPNVLLVLLAGVWADRLPRQRVMLGSDLVRAAAQAGTAGVFLAGQRSLVLLIVLQMVYGAGDAFFSPASTGLVPRLVDVDELQQANSLMHLARNITGIAGPALGGILVVASNAGIAMAFDAATFVASAAFLARLHLAGDEGVVERSGIGAELREGWREFSSRSWIWVSVLVFGIYQLALFPALTVLGPDVARSRLGGAGAWAAILTAGSIGAIAGTMLALRIRPRRLLLASHALSMLAAVPLLLLAGTSTTAVIAAAMAVGWAALSLADTLWYTALQSHVPDRALSRVSSYDWLGSIVLNPLGFVLIGPVAGAAGVDATLVGAACLLAAAPLCAMAVPGIRHLTRVERPVPAPT